MHKRALPVKAAQPKTPENLALFSIAARLTCGVVIETKTN
ncbi:Lytic transglycosylase catalytic subunit [Sinorhizobium medicae]|uniref:Lytic transglycosylase catalytic subunit n=1 Tax=Sinorhizobium medicae TaxID=110321 RepID=A0A508WQX2_9HYPH|nr:Lytic transglycosylase catalytic subunit [Sinorhizobium medicae]